MTTIPTLIDVPEADENTPENVGRELIRRVNLILARLIADHKESYHAFWNCADPERALAAMGTKAALWLACAHESVELIRRLAAMVGKTIDDFIPPEEYIPRRPFVVHEDGTVTLGDAA